MRKHVILLGITLLLVIGLVGGIIFLSNRTTAPKQFAFTPTPTVVPTPSSYRKIAAADKETASWKKFTDSSLKYSLQYPDTVMIDARQTSQGRINVFIFEEDKSASLPGKVTALYLADTQKKGIDGFSAFSRGDCGKDCNISHENTQWITLNNVYGVKNPHPNDVHNYYLTDKDMSGSVLNVYVGGYIGNEKAVQEKTEIFEEMIKTLRFDR